MCNNQVELFICRRAPQAKARRADHPGIAFDLTSTTGNLNQLSLQGAVSSFMLDIILTNFEADSLFTRLAGGIADLYPRIEKALRADLSVSPTPD